MAERRQKIRGTTLQLDQDLGLEGLLAYDTEKKELRVYDALTLGGKRIPNLETIDSLYKLPNRLTPAGQSIAGNTHSANEALLNGFYYTDSLVTDQPEVGAGTIVVSTTAAGTVIVQKWTRGSTGAIYRRQRDAAGTWSAWVRVMDLTFLTTDPTAVAYDSARLGGQLPAYYTAINARLGYTAANKAGDDFVGNVTVGGTFGVTGVATFASALTVIGNLVTVSGPNPSVKLNDTTAGSDDFWLYADSDHFYILSDRGDDGNFDSPHPLDLNNTLQNAQIYGATVWTSANDGAASGLDANLVNGNSAVTTGTPNTVAVRDGLGQLSGTNIIATSAANSGTLYMGSNTSHYLQYDGANYIIKNGTLYLDNGYNLAWQSTISRIQSDCNLIFAGGMLAYGPALNAALDGFQSGQLTPVVGGALSVAHGLARVPRSYAAYAYCIGAENGFGIGDEILMHNTITPVGSTTNVGTGAVVTVDATNINCRIGSNQFFSTIAKSTGVPVNLTVGNWRVILRAWA